VAEGGQPVYFVDRTGRVNEQIHALAHTASTPRGRKALVRALNKVVKTLSIQPLDWGDPEHNTRKQGGVVCHGIVPPLFVRFGVFEAEKVVIILDVRLLPGSALD
jgi:hypothetical protein